MLSLMRTRVLTRKASMGYMRKWEWQAVSHRALVSSTVQNKNNFSYNDCSTPWLAMVASALLVSLTTVSSMTLIHSESLDQENQSSNKTLPFISRDEVEKHTTEDTGVWVTYNDGVFDLTSFIANHPGGKDKIFLAAGKDLSELWQQPPYQLHYRSPLVFELLEEHRIGNLPVEDIKVDEFQRNIRTRKVKKTYSTSKIYECVIVGSGLAGLQCANSLIDTCSDEISQDDVLILEASDYVGGRVKQIDSFVAGIPIDVGAEFLHGGNTVLARTANENGDELKELFCWAQGDGGCVLIVLNLNFQ
jgi:cytochrome b involved in lipid metabolism